MTTPEEFTTNVMTTLKYLDTILPSGSHVVFIGLLHGHLIYDLMNEKPYPYFDITYGELWEILTLAGESNTSSLNPWYNHHNTPLHSTTQHEPNTFCVVGDG